MVDLSDWRRVRGCGWNPFSETGFVIMVTYDVYLIVIMVLVAPLEKLLHVYYGAGLHNTQQRD